MRVKSNLLARSSKYFLSSNSVSESCAAPRGANLGKPRFSEGRFFCVPTDLALQDTSRSIDINIEIDRTGERLGPSCPSPSKALHPGSGMKTGGSATVIAKDVSLDLS